MLAERLETESAGDLGVYASLCYICSGNIENLLRNWFDNSEGHNTPLGLQVGSLLCFIEFKFTYVFEIKMKT